MFHTQYAPTRFPQLGISNVLMCHWYHARKTKHTQKLFKIKNKKNGPLETDSSWKIIQIMQITNFKGYIG